MKISKIHTLSIEEFQKLVYECSSLAEILKRLGLYISSGNYRPLKRRLDDDGIDYQHIKLGKGHSKGKTFPSNWKGGIPLSEIMVENSIYEGCNLKKKLLSANLIENKCCKCNQNSEWQGMPITLQLDHINGNSRDNRIENLRILCPNCHSQTDTYGSKNKKIGAKIVISKYCECGTLISKRALQCRKCSGIKSHPTKINWPTDDELIKMLSESNYVQVAKKLGVSDVSVKKRYKKSICSATKTL